MESSGKGLVARERQQNTMTACLNDMARKEIEQGKKAANEKEGGIYDLTTPRWSRYYQAMRKRVRFPRYYKKKLNW